MLGFRFIKFQPGEYVLKYKNGKVVKEGMGISFYYYVPTTSIVLVPTVVKEVPFVFNEVTSDFQTVTIQGQVSYRIIDQKKIINYLNYNLDLKTKGMGYQSDDPKKLSQHVINIVKVLTKKTIEDLNLKDAIISSEILAKRILVEIQKSEEIELLGLQILGLAILSILPNKETARALETQTREQILKKADEAIYERRNASIEQERIVKENELNTEIAIENKKKQIRDKQIETERLVQQKQNQLKEEKMLFEIDLEDKNQKLIKIKVENEKIKADAKAYELSAVMKALEGIDANIIQSLSNMGMQPNKLIALAFQEIAEKAEKIGQLNISPDLLGELLKGKR